MEMIQIDDFEGKTQKDILEISCSEFEPHKIQSSFLCWKNRCFSFWRIVFRRAIIHFSYKEAIYIFEIRNRFSHEKTL